MTEFNALGNFMAMVLRKGLYVLGIGFSPRANGNSDQLLEWALTAIKQDVRKIKNIYLRDYHINHCLGCRFCEEKGVCIQKDDFLLIEKELKKADFLVISTPVFFLGVPGLAKAMIDRGQTLWARKYLLERPPDRAGRGALLLMCAGSDGKEVFDCVKRTVRAFLDVAGFKLKLEIGVAKVDEKGEVLRLVGLKNKIESLSQKLLN